MAGKKAGGDDLKSSIRIRMYRVGFGDFFLMSLRTAEGPRHILVDCGVHAGDLGSIQSAVDDLARTTDRHLSLIIVTHRHADHISGFASCAKAFAEFKVDRIWMSAWDDPSDKALSDFQERITGVAQQLQISLSARLGDDAEELQDMMENITGATLGAKGGNAAALAMLREGGFKEAPKPDYYKANDEPELPESLSNCGLVAKILGPPVSPTLMRRMDNQSEEYFSALAQAAESAAFRPFDKRWELKNLVLPERALWPFLEARKLEEIVLKAQPDALAAAARAADKTINNQSLVVHFTFAKKKMLFAGDAQWGNWQNFLYGDVDRVPDQLSMGSKDLLGSLDFYKVGHHGSTNATPISALDAMPQGLVAMCSTEPGQYGKEDKGSEVPRVALLDALRKKGPLACSDQVGVEKGKIDASPLNRAFSKGHGYIDWTTG